MKDIIFWKHWDKQYRIAINFLVILFLSSLVFLTVGILAGEDFVINWLVLNIKEPITVSFDSFSKGLFTFNFVTENFVVFQKFYGSPLNVNITGSYLFAGLLAISLIFYLASVTDLTRFWYIVAMGVFIIFMVNLKLEHLQILGRIDRIPLIAIFLIVIPVSYYLHAIKKEVAFLNRVLIFSLITVACLFAIYYLAEVPNPFLYITNYGVLGVLIIACAFILMISHEIISAFIYLLTVSTTNQSKNTMQHFLVISVFYLANITILYLYETKIIDWDFYYINPYILLIISSIIGFWGLITRSEVFKNALPFYPWAPILYLTVGTMAIGTIGFLFVTGNDPILEVIKDTIIYGHLGFGGIFFIYILANFGALIGKNVPVYKVIYKPTTMPYFTFRFAGLIAVAAFFLKENIEVPIYHSLSGYYNGIGDLYTANREYYVAEQYYKLGSDYGYQNHRSNYALASLAAQHGNLASASYFYELAINKRPTEYAIVNLSNTQIENDEFINGLFTLSDGLEEFPRSGPIMVNAGLAFRRTDILDSAALFFHQASQYGVSERLGKNNFLALASENNWALDVDSLKDEYYLKGNEIAPVNYSVFLNHNNKNGNYNPDFPSDSILGLVSSSRLINHATNSFMNGDQTFLPVLDSLSRKFENYRYAEELRFALALGYYKNDRLDRSLSILRGMAANNLQKAGLYSNTLGLIAMKEDAWDIAIESFNNAIRQRYSGSMLNKSIALTEAGDLENAIESWRQLLELNPEDATAKLMLQALTESPENLESWDDPEKYQFVRYRRQELEGERLQNVMESFEDPAYGESLILEKARDLLNEGKYDGVRELLENTTIRTSGLKNLSRMLYLISNEDQLEMSDSDIEMISQESNADHSTLRRYLRALNAVQANDTAAAVSEYETLGYGNPFFVPGVIKASEFFSNWFPDEITGYSILVEAVQYNENSSILWKKYTEECLIRGYDNYAEQGLNVLQSLLDERSFQEFSALYNQWQKEYEQEDFD